ncbi:PfkB family carbohydrate kinase [Methylobacterium sp. A54F]
MQVFVVGSFVVACSVKVARLPRTGESLDATDFVSEPGGKGFNLALAAARLGAGVDGAFAIGSDAFAAVARSAFRQEGLAEAMLHEKPGSTGAGVGFVDPAGENCLAVSLGANRRLGAEDIDDDAVARAHLVLATFESPDAPIAAAFARARALGIPTLLNPSPTRPIPPGLLADTAILLLNRVEAGDLGLTDGDGFAPRRLADLMEGGPGTVVVTLGAAGAVAFRRGSPPLRQAAFRVAAVDTIGAGDAFGAGLAVALIEGRPLDQALRRAAACAALTVGRFGAFEAFPSSAALDRFLAEAGSPPAGSGSPPAGSGSPPAGSDRPLE